MNIFQSRRLNIGSRLFASRILFHWLCTTELPMAKQATLIALLVAGGFLITGCGGGGGGGSASAPAPASNYTIGGTVSGLTGTGLTLQNNSGNNLAVSANGSFTFATSIASGAAFGVTVFNQPTGPSQTCTVASGSGTVGTANVTSVAIRCGTEPEGVYGGTLTGSTSTAFEMLILDTGEFWSLYGTQTATYFLVAGFVQGTGSANNGAFNSSNAKDFGFRPGAAGTVTGSYNKTAKTISGTASTTAGTVSFSGGPIAGSLYNYDAAASLSTVSGAWSTTATTGETITLNVTAGGSATGTSSLGCSMTGTVSPRPSGKNVFNVALTFGPAPCLLPGQPATGIAVAYPVSSGGLTQLIVGVTDSARNVGLAAFGTR
jgi:hypothetical protein